MKIALTPYMVGCLVAYSNDMSLPDNVQAIEFEQFESAEQLCLDACIDSTYTESMQELLADIQTYNTVLASGKQVQAEFNDIQLDSRTIKPHIFDGAMRSASSINIEFDKLDSKRTIEVLQIVAGSFEKIGEIACKKGSTMQSADITITANSVIAFRLTDKNLLIKHCSFFA